MIGLTVSGGIALIDDFTLKVDRDFNGSYESTELVEDFNTTSGYDAETLAHDAAGNLMYDGVQKYTYDAWNRLVKVAHAYRDSGGTLQAGSAWVTMAYDGRGRRITKAVTGTGSLDCTYHYYYDRDSLVETRNGSDEPLKQHVWGLTYIDELCQITIDGDPSDNVNPAPADQVRWAMQDANFNVLGVADETGVLAERYEYTPYGQRTAFFSAGANDAGAYSPAYAGRRAVLEQFGDQPYAVCDVGHQGLVHDEESGLVYNRARMLHPLLGRFAQRDSLGYVDGSNLYAKWATIASVDPNGTCKAMEEFPLGERDARPVPGRDDIQTTGSTAIRNWYLETNLDFKGCAADCAKIVITRQVAAVEYWWSKQSKTSKQHEQTHVRNHQAAWTRSCTSGRAVLEAANKCLPVEFQSCLLGATRTAMGADRFHSEAAELQRDCDDYGKDIDSEVCVKAKKHREFAGGERRSAIEKFQKCRKLLPKGWQLPNSLF